MKIKKICEDIDNLAFVDKLLILSYLYLICFDKESGASQWK
jgi:hypothetical protein